MKEAKTPFERLHPSKTWYMACLNGERVNSDFMSLRHNVCSMKGKAKRNNERSVRELNQTNYNSTNSSVL